MYTCILYDGRTGEYIAACDPIGIRPLYYGYDRQGVILFAGEPKNLVGLVERIAPFPSGYYWKDGRFVCYCDIAAVAQVSHDDLETACRRIREKLVAGIESALWAMQRSAFGGLDSSLVCVVAAPKSRMPIKTFAIGMRGDAIDLKYARQVAEYIGSEHREIYMTPEEVTGSLEEQIYLLGTFDITTIRTSVGMVLLCRAIHAQTDIRVPLTGEISDELFGYKYTNFAPSAQAFQQEARLAFGDLDFVKYVMALDPEESGTNAAGENTCSGMPLRTAVIFRTLFCGGKRRCFRTRLGIPWWII